MNFGGTSGVVTKMQSAINTATRTAGNNLYGYSCNVGIVNSNLRFTSKSHLLPHDGTNGSSFLQIDNDHAHSFDRKVHEYVLIVRIDRRINNHRL